MYKCEVLFLRGISPWRPVSGIGDLEALVGLARRLLAANRDRSGHVTTGMMMRGAENWVYARRGRPCRRCGAPVRVAGQAARQRGDPQDRVTFWCPRCQPDTGS